MRLDSLPNTSTDRGFIPLNGSTETSTKLIPREIQKRRDIEISLLSVNDHFTAKDRMAGMNCFTTALFPVRLRPEVQEILLSYHYDTTINFTIGSEWNQFKPNRSNKN